MKTIDVPWRFALAVVLALVTASVSAADTPREIAQRTMASVVLVTIEHGIDQDFTFRFVREGFGFVIDDDIVVTNRRLVIDFMEGVASGWIRPIGHEEQFSIDGVVAESQDLDLVLLAIDGLDAPALPLKDPGEVHVGDEVYVIGNPRGLEGTLSTGNVSAVHKFEEETVIQITAPVSPGSSGGPVLNASGEAIGVALEARNGGQNYNFIISSDALASLLEKETEVRPLDRPRKDAEDKPVEDDFWVRFAVDMRDNADEGDSASMFNLGVMHENGLGVRQDDRAAVRWYRKAAELGHAPAMLSLGVLHNDGRGVSHDAGEAARLFQNAAEQGNAIAMFKLGDMYEAGRGVPQDDREAAQMYRQAAEQGHADAMSVLGLMYAKGRGVLQDHSEAVQWQRQAAERGHVQAMCNLGDMYLFGQGVQADHGEAVRWYRQAAEQGHPRAMFSLADMYKFGMGVPADDREAVRWYRRAAEQGFTPAMYYLGYMYTAGRSLPQDDGEAYRWYRKAAERGHLAAMHSLGVTYATGRGVQQDDREAVRWFRKAAEHGHADAMRNLGYMYVNGRGMPQDDMEAYVWLSLAAAFGHDEAVELRDNIGHELPGEVRIKAQQRANELFEQIQKRQEEYATRLPSETLR